MIVKTLEYSDFTTPFDTKNSHADLCPIPDEQVNHILIQADDFLTQDFEPSRAAVMKRRLPMNAENSTSAVG